MKVRTGAVTDGLKPEYTPTPLTQQNVTLQTPLIQSSDHEPPRPEGLPANSSLHAVSI